MVYIQSPTAEIRRGKKERNSMKIWSALLHRATIITQRNLLSVSDITVAVYKTKYVLHLNKASTAGWYISDQEQQSCTNDGLVALVARDHRARFSQ